MNKFARFDENPAMTLQDIKETKCYGRKQGGTHGRTDVKTVYPPQTKIAGGIKRRKGSLPIDDPCGTPALLKLQVQHAPIY